MAGNVEYVEEPDNHEHEPFALRAKRRIGRGYHPSLEVGQEARDYERLWRSALGEVDASTGYLPRIRRRAATRLLAAAGEARVRAALLEPGGPALRLRVAEALALPAKPRREARVVVVKSVHAQLALDWLAARFSPTALIVLREPLNVISSWRAMGWLEPDRPDMLDELGPVTRDALVARYDVLPPPAGASTLKRASWVFGALTSALLAASEAHLEWPVAVHEDLCRRPHEGFKELAARLGLEWTPEADGLIEGLDRPGEGYETRRVAAGLPEVWRSRLAPGEVEEIRTVLEGFPVREWATAR
jgi:hypothetical protein